MTVEAYKQRMAELGVDREALDTGLPESKYAIVRKNKVSPLLPGWRKNGRKMARQAMHRGPKKK